MLRKLFVIALNVLIESVRSNKRNCNCKNKNVN